MNSKENYFQSGKPAQLRQTQLLTGFSPVTTMIKNHFSKSVLLMILVFMIMPILMIKVIRAQESAPLPPARPIINQIDDDSIARKKDKNMFSSETQDIFSFNLGSIFSNCSQKPIVIGETVESSLTDSDCVVNNRFANEYTFAGNAGEQISITMNSSRGSKIDSYLYLSTNGVMLAANDDSGDSLDSQISDINGYFTLPVTGTYTIRATTFDAIGRKFPYTGNYILSLNSNVGTPPISGIALDYDDSKRISDNNSSNSVCSYTLSSSIDSFNSNFLNGTIYWLKSGGSVTHSVNTQPGCTWAIVNNTPSMLVIDNGGGEKTGTGTFVYHSLANNGAFRNGSISVNTAVSQAQLNITNYQDSPAPVCSQSSISIGQTLNNNNLSNSDCTIYGAYAKEYTFSGTANQKVSISMSSSQFTPYFYLRDPNGTYLVFGTSSAITNFTLPSTGNYTIQAASATRLPSTPGTGVFTLSVTIPVTTYNITGRVTVNGEGLPGVTVNLGLATIPNESNGSESNNDINSPNVSVFTTSNGDYTFTNVSSGYYFITPTKAGYSFTPQSLPYNTNSTPTPANFTAQLVCNYSIKPTGNPNVPDAGGTFSFSFITSPGCPTSVSSNVPWITASSSGGINGTVTYTVEQNNTTSPRPGTITFGNQTFTVTQAAAPNCTYSIAPTSAPIGAGGGNGSFTITAPTGCVWTAVSDSNWLITSGSGSGTGTILYTASANTATSPRIGIITVGNGQTFTLTQAAAPACTYSVSPTSAIVEATSGTYNFNIFASAGCASWTATTSTSWITTTSSGTGNGTASYTVAANPAGSARQGTITVGGQVFTVNQKSPTVTTYTISGQVTNGGNGLSGVRVVLSGPIPAETITDSGGNYRFSGLTPASYTVTPSLPGAIISPTKSDLPLPVPVSNQTANFALAVCTYSLSASGKGVPTEESSGGFVVNPSAGCGSISWQAISNVPWIIVSNGGVGAGTAPVGYFVQRNYGAARSGVIAVNGQLYTIVQSAFQSAATNKTNSPQVDAPCGTTVANTATNLRRQVFSFAGSSGSFNVKTDRSNLAECRWSAVADSKDNWIKVATERGLNDDKVSFTIEENPDSEPRFGTIAVNGEVYTVVQTGKPYPGCSYALVPDRFNYPTAAGGVGSFGVLPSPLDCQWMTIIDKDDLFTNKWLKITDINRSESGSGTKNFTIETNEGTKTNESSIVIGDKVLTITQNAGQLANCRWAFSSPIEDVLAGGVSGKRVNVLTATGCNWTAAASPNSWIHITGGVGTTNGTVSFNVDPNMGTTPRGGRISITQDSSVFFTITQAAAQTCSYTIDPGFQSVMNSGATGTIRVTASDSCTTQQWSAVSNANWITITSEASGTRSGSTSFVAQANPTPVQRSGTITVAGRTFTVNQAAGNIIRRTSSDFDGDGRADISVFRPSNGVWYLFQSTGGFTGMQFGVASDKLVPADYDGDGKTDLAVYRNGTWYLNRSTAGFTGFAFGAPDDIPQPADFDGDGKADLAVYRPSNGTWYVYNLVNNQFTFAQFGAATDLPVVGDYNGDGKAGFAVFRPSNGFWYIAKPTGTPAQNFDSVQLGQAGDKPAPADYDGDGKTDEAVYRPSNGVWYVQRSQAGLFGIQFGAPTDLPVAADYDGDGKADVAVFRNGTWYLQQSTNGFTGVQFGASTDKPVPNAFVP